MPYRKKRYSKGYHPYTKATAPAVAFVAMKAAKMVAKKYLNVEQKYIDSNGTSSTVVLNSGFVSPITQTAQGDTEADRNGNSIKFTSFFLRANIVHNSGGSIPQKMRLMIVRDNMARGAYPLITEVLQIANVLSPIDTNADSRFSILFDRILTTSTNGRAVVNLKKYMKISSHIKYIGTSAAEASTGQGACYLMAISDSASNGPSIQFYSRFRFVDN